MHDVPSLHLSFVSKVVEKVVEVRSAAHAARHHLLPTQSRTGSVLGAVPSAAVMGARRTFSRGKGQIQGCKKLIAFS